MPSLEKLAIRGTIWTFAGYGSGQVLRFIGNLILTRLLAPEMFGLMTLVQTFLLGLSLFSDIGIRPSIIQNKRGDDPVFLNTAWTMQVIRGFVLWGACFVIALPVSRFYNDSRLIWLIPLVGLTALADGFGSTSLATLNRKVSIAKLTVFEVGAQAASLVVMVIWAFFQRSIWALISGSLFGSVLRLVWSHRLEPGTRNRFAWDREAVQELVAFGRWIFISTAMTFLATQADRLVLGKLFSLEMLGVYTVAFTFADLPTQIISQINGKVVFPVISQRIDLPREQLLQKILQKRRLLLLGLTVGIAFISCFGDVIILNLYDARYKDAAWMLSILALGIWIAAMSRTTNSVLLAIGKPLYGAYGSFLKFLYMVMAIPFGFSQFGMLGAIVAIAFADLPFYSAVSYGSWREKLSMLIQDVSITMLLLGLVTLILAVRYFSGFGLPIDGIY